MLKIKNLSKSFNGGTENELNIFKGFNLHIKESEFVAILGSNGCGKSTLFNLISGALKEDTGSILLDEKSINNLKEEERAWGIGKVHQDPSKGVSPSLTILENLSLADKKCEKFSLRNLFILSFFIRFLKENFSHFLSAKERFSLRNLIKKDKIKRFIEILKEVDLGLENKLNTQVKFLSGGQRQALSLIMATLKKPKLLLLDEHTAALDPKTSKVIMEKTKQLIDKQHITAMMISHNLRDAVQYADRIIMLDKGKIILDVESKKITESELVKIYNSKIEKEQMRAAG